MEIQTLRRELKLENATDSSSQAPADVLKERLEVMMLHLTENLAQYGGHYLLY